jgi:hypothetical protein
LIWGGADGIQLSSGGYGFNSLRISACGKMILRRIQRVRQSPTTLQ